MKTLEESILSEKKALILWRTLFFVSLLLFCSPVLADTFFSFEASMAGAFTGVVLLVISLVMLSIYRKRLRLISSLAKEDSLLEVWESPDRYGSNAGTPIRTYFNENGIFYAGKPYCRNSYDCVIREAKIIDDEGPALSVEYTVPSSRMGTFRYKAVVNIPLPAGKEESALRLARYYSSEMGEK